MPDTQYFTNIDGKYVKDAEARQQLNDLEDYVESLDQPWTPLQDGYSNFWFELTNDTLSPWLNFSAKNANAVIDWGDGSGEVALDTLTPTHTYSKAGKYIVKVKGVTGIAAQNAQASYIPKYTTVLTNVELNNEVTTLGGNAFWRCFGLKNVGGTAVITAMSSGVTSYTATLETFVKLNVTATNTNFYQTFCLKKIVLGSALTTLSNNSFANCYSLEEIHIEATTPPTFGGVSVLTGLPSNYVIYVPVGYGDTYKATEGWSTYADHILEEGQTPNRAMLAKFNSAKTEEPQDDMR